MKKYIIWFLYVSIGINIGLAAYFTQALHDKDECITELSGMLLPLNAKPVRNSSDNTVNISFEPPSQEIDHLTYEVHTLNETLKYYRSFIDQALLKMSKQAQAEIAENEWHYALELSYYNDEGQVILPVEDQMVIHQSHFTISLSERRHINAITNDAFLLDSLKLSESDFNLEINGNDYKAFSGSDDESLGYFVTYKTYDFEYPSQDVTIELSEALQDKLGYDKATITVQIGSY